MDELSIFILGVLFIFYGLPAICVTCVEIAKIMKGTADENQ